MWDFFFKFFFGILHFHHLLSGNEVFSENGLRFFEVLNPLGAADPSQEGKGFKLKKIEFEGKNEKTKEVKNEGLKDLRALRSHIFKHLFKINKVRGYFV